MKAILPVLISLFLLFQGCGFTPEEDNLNYQLTGKVKDPSGNLLSDVKVFLIYHFDYSGNGQGGTDSPALGVYLEQNYPNPFSDTTTFRYYIQAETSYVRFEILRFDSLIVIPTALTDTLLNGVYVWTPDFSQLLPSNGYKVLLHVTEDDSTYVIEHSFMRSYISFDSSIINTAPNAVTSNGQFEILYNTLPIDYSYVRTTEVNSAPVGNLKVNEVLTLVLYKPGYHIYKEDISLHRDRYMNKEFILQPE